MAMHCEVWYLVILLLRLVVELGDRPRVPHGGLLVVAGLPRCGFVTLAVVVAVAVAVVVDQGW